MDTSRADNYRVVRFFSNGNQFFKEEYLVQQGIGATAPTGFSYAAGDSAGDHWLVPMDAGGIPSSLPQPPRQQLVAELAGSNDQVNFRISHAAVDATHDTFFAGYPSGTFTTGPYDRLIFKIDVDCTRYYRNDRNSQASTKTLSDTVTIPDFTQ